VVHALCFARERKGLGIYGWVVMDNHFHAIVAGPALAQTIGDLKKLRRARSSRS
jgi:REP element-mobilizing transposase RayT